MSSTSSTDPLIGALLDGRYDVTGRIARGGMATVYLATDRRLDREVAVKVMHAHMVDDEAFVARFIREARSAARINDPHVVAVFDQGREGDVLYLVMEYVPGMTLRDVLNRQGPLTPGQALDVLIPVLDALTAAYQAGIVHRDVKPENVLLTETRRGSGVKVTDFGLARAVSTSSRVASSTGTVIGTPAYLSPELITRGVADARSDVYSAGVMLYELLVGSPPFEGDVPVQVAFRHVNEDVPPPTSVDPGLPESLDDLVLAATARDPDERPVDAAAYAAMVRRVRSHLSETELDRVPPGHRPPGGSRRQETTRTLPPPRHTTGTGTGPRRFPAAGPVAPHATQRLNPGPQFRAPREPWPATPETTGAGPVTKVRRRRPGTAFVLAALLLVAALVGAGAWFVTAGPGSYVTIPDATGTRSQAGERLTGTGLEPTFTSAYSEGVPSGRVIRTEPGAGARVHRHSRVSVVVSRGTAWTTMPSVVGMTRDRAGDTLSRLDIRIANDPRQAYSDTVAAGSVIASDPAPSARVRRGGQVTVTVSRGPAPVDVPAVGGRSHDQAYRTLQAAGLKVTTTGTYDDHVPKGQVMSQVPASGAAAHRGDTVTLTVSKGPPLVEVPSVVGQQVDDARSALQDAGFKVKLDNVLGGFFQTVRSQSPDAGGRAPKGSTITLKVV